MNCHICGQSAVGQCQACWRFYCRAHGDLICQRCLQRRTAEQGQRGASFAVLGHHGPHRAAPHPRFPDRHDLGGETLEGVIGVAQTARVGNTEIDLVSLELYASGFIANLRLRGTADNLEPGDPPIFPRHPDFSPQVTDDLGNVYEGSPRGGSGGSRGHWRSTYHFSPAPLASAKALHFTIVEVRWMAHGPGQQSSIEPGPWEFHVAL